MSCVAKRAASAASHDLLKSAGTAVASSHRSVGMRHDRLRLRTPQVQHVLVNDEQLHNKCRQKTRHNEA